MRFQVSGKAPRSFGQDMLEAGARNRAGRKGVALHDQRRFGQYRLHAQGPELAPVEGWAEIGKAAVGPTRKPDAEIVLAASIELQILAQA